MSDELDQQVLHELRQQNYLTEQSQINQVKKDDNVAFNEYSTKLPVAQRNIGKLTVGLTGSFLQASVALAPQSAQAQLKSTVAVVQMGMQLGSIGFAIKEMFEIAAAKANHAPKAPAPPSANNINGPPAIERPAPPAAA